MSKPKRITNIGDEHVVIRRRHLKEMLERLELELPAHLRAEFERAGRFFVIPVDAWRAVIEIATGHCHERPAAGGGCQDFCDSACSADGDCDVAGGSPGRCVGICENGEVYLENPV